MGKGDVQLVIVVPLGHGIMSEREEQGSWRQVGRVERYFISAGRVCKEPKHDMLSLECEKKWEMATNEVESGDAYTLAILTLLLSLRKDFHTVTCFFTVQSTWRAWSLPD